MRIAFLLIDNMLATSQTNAYELFYAANQAVMASGKIPANGIAELVKVASKAERISLPSGLSLKPDSTLEHQAFDIIYVPAMWRNPRPAVRNNPDIVEWIRWQYEHGAIINSTGTGVWFTASAGLLSGKPATTHWYFFERFAADFPLAELKRQHFITTSENLYCAASVNALTDLTLHHVHRFYGREIADHLSHHFSHEVRQPFDELSFNADHNTNHPDELILQVQLWMQTHYAKANISMHKVAKLFGMSQRNFGRRFKDAANITPLEYLQQCRFNAAKGLLQTSNLSIKEIAYRVGYIDVSYFSKLFREFASITPKEYRKTVRATLFSSATASTNKVDARK